MKTPLAARAGCFALEERAASMVEFAIVLPVLLMCMFAVIDCGRAMFLYNNLQDTARRAARFGAAQQPSTPLPTQCGGKEVGVADSVAAWVQEFNTNPIVADSVKPYVTVSCDVSTGSVTGVVTNVNVAIAGYPFRPLTPFAGLAANAMNPNGMKITKRAGARSEGAPDGD